MLRCVHWLHPLLKRGIPQLITDVRLYSLVAMNLKKEISLKVRDRIAAGPVLCIVAASFILGLPMLLYGPLVDGHDTYEHLAYLKYFSEQFWHGDLYPRWFIDMNVGLGSPSFFVFPPLPAYIFVLLEPVTRVLHFNAFNVAAWLPLVISGLSAFLWLQTLVSKKTATLCAILYMLMPYHLAIDMYRRTAIPECWALAWMPLVLYFTVGILAGKRRDSVGLAITFALMIFSHLISVAIFFWIPIGLAMILSLPGQKIRSVLRIALAMGLGASISSVYLLSALANAKYIPVSRILNFELYRWSNNLVTLGRGLFIHSAQENFVQEVSWTVVSMIVIVAICGISALKSEARGPRMLVMFWIAVCGLSIFMESKLSGPIWHHVHKLDGAVQFPWRFNALLCLGALPLIATYLSAVHRKIGTLRIISSGIFVLVIATWLFAYGNVWRRYKVDVGYGPKDEDHLVNEDDGWLAAWIVPGTRQRASLIASSGPRARFREGVGTAQVLLWKPRHIQLETGSFSGGWVMVNQFYYPTWTAELIDQGKHAMVRPAMPEGLLEVQVPEGSQNVRLDIPVSTTEYFGRWLSALSLLLCLILGFSRRGRNQMG